jgi:hypothetical protein
LRLAAGSSSRNSFGPIASARELDALAGAECQLSDWNVGYALQAEFVDQRVRPLGDAPFLAPGQGKRERIGEKPAPRQRVRADSHVVTGRHGGEQRNILKRSGEAKRGNLVYGEARQRAPVEEDRTRVGVAEAGDAVEQRRLPGAVRSDQSADRALVDVETHILKRRNAAEPHPNAVVREQRRLARFGPSVSAPGLGLGLGQPHEHSVPIAIGRTYPALSA